MYKSFSSVYDIFIHADYDEIVNHIQDIWKRAGISPALVLELACGTGNIAVRLARKGYDMIGIDISSDMLAQANEKSEGLDILYICRDMRDFELYGTVDACVCLMDGINYILELSELQDVFRLVNNYLNPGGIFIFDINTKYKFRDILSDNSFCETTEDAAYIWENCYDEEQCVNEYYVNFFIEDKQGKYERHEECHYQKGYEISEITEALNKAGLKVKGVYDGLTFEKPNPESERLYFVVLKE